VRKIECSGSSSVAFGAGDYGSVRVSQWHIVIAQHKFDSPWEIDITRIEFEATRRDVLQECHQTSLSYAIFDEIANFGHDGHWDDKWRSIRTEHLKCCLKVLLSFVSQTEKN
jgi:hypothetical protein